MHALASETYGANFLAMVQNQISPVSIVIVIRIGKITIFECALPKQSSVIQEACCLGIHTGMKTLDIRDTWQKRQATNKKNL